ncbi:MAG TPA: right-handed parallel beta-helix repeat-containing protein [Candidatus Sulfopaludibacter sp.]|jgi:parallel beta-helix repeat protein|nr:right-handed parallel beta-helix repeat-containing protein [Candidatus Sulfopaludibacter sp.]
MFHFTRSTQFLFLISIATAASAATWCVNPTGTGGCKTTIGAAVTSAAAGDTVSVAPGTYKESVTIGKTLTLVGSDAATTIIEAKGLPVGIIVDGINNAKLGGVFISGFTVQNAKYEGILVLNASAVTVSSNIVQGNNAALDFSGGAPACPGIAAYETGEGFDCGEGIHLMGTDHANVVGNTVQNNAGGILVSDDTAVTHHNLISGNIVANNIFDCGITIASHVPADLTKSTTALGIYSTMVVGNQSTGNGIKGAGAGVGIFASAPGTAAYNNIVTGNTLTGNGIPGVAIHGHTPGQNLNGNQIIGNTISGNGADTADAFTPGTAGVNVFSVSPVTGTVISQNIISGQALDVVVNAPGDTRVVRNSFTRGVVGILNMGAGTVTAEGDYWGCPTDPRFQFPGFNLCASAVGAVNINTWSSAPISK